MASELGRIRQSAVIMNYGPGAIIDFRIASTGAAVSVIAAGLESWEERDGEFGIHADDLKAFIEPRLAEKLNKRFFRHPPVAQDNPGKNQMSKLPALTGVRFPTWLQCPGCGVLKPARRWGFDPGEPSRHCPRCSAGLHGSKRVHVVPVRFVTACRNGHLDEFPWAWWVHHGQSGCTQDREFRIRTEGPGLSGLVVSCPTCNGSRSMEGVFSQDALKGLVCKGKRPWLRDGDETCTLRPAVLQRGASNLYFPEFETALVIPPWSDKLWESLAWRRDDIINAVDENAVRLYLEAYVWNDRPERRAGMTFDEFANRVIAKRNAVGKVFSGNIRWDEYQQLASGEDTPDSGGGDGFIIRSEAIPPRVPHLTGLVRVESIREVRALRAFTRIEAYPGSDGRPVQRQFLSRTSRAWLPAIEVRGEGIFLSLDGARLEAWLERQDVVARASMVREPENSRILNPDPDRKNQGVPARTVAKYLLLHSLAHVLMRQLSLQCGYSSSSLRERVFVGEGETPMAGLMIYTATSDADGTLGGLQREGRPERFGPTFVEAIRGATWCSSDPLCVHGVLAATESSSLASCHSCLLAPETSCEDYNRYLDRALLVGTPENPGLGYFRDLATGTDGGV